MKFTTTSTTNFKTGESAVFITAKYAKLKEHSFSKEEIDYVTKNIKDAKGTIAINRLGSVVFVVNPTAKKEAAYTTEEYRKAGHTVCTILNKNKVKKVTVFDFGTSKENGLGLVEGIALSNYQFLKYVSKAKEKANSLTAIAFFSKNAKKQDLTELEVLVAATCEARTLVNEPQSFLTSVQIAKEMQRLGKDAGIKVEVFNKKKIEALKMGGLLAVNYGSVVPPTFTVMEWKPAKAKNKKPLVLVGKGIVYDTGGLSLKPTANSMDLMKSDMGGAAAVIGGIYAIAKAKLPVHVIALVPSTDNRPGKHAYAPGDVITMHNNVKVEVLNTDAEGRMVLGDALSYAQKYKPELVLDVATLTGAAVRAFGPYGIPVMGTASEKQFGALAKAGDEVFERTLEQPFWDEYGDMVKSEIADIKNIGGAEAGHITAGKFLEHFTNYPWVHLDIAGPAYLLSPDNYRGKWGTGVGVRLFFQLAKNMS